ncbi:glycoside hydrolase family 25 protein [Acinetobacter sp. ANC 4636]
MKAARKSHLHLVRTLTATLVVLLLCSISLVLLQNQPAEAQDHPVQGFDVSHHQGKIDWKKISPHKYQFVYLKATEGGDYQDPSFQQNWLKAREQGLNVGAYHYYRLCREAKIQAANFIATVPNKADALAPVIDLEYDANCLQNSTQEQLLKQIQVMEQLLHQHYGKPPIIYTSKTFYHIVLMGHMPHNALWIRDYDEAYPKLKDQHGWMFWQYTQKGHIEGIQQPVDLNAYAGSMAQWQSYLRSLGVIHH